MVKSIRLLTILLMVCLVLPVHAEARFGLGIIVGEPTGVSVKQWLSETRAVDAAAAWSFSENDSFQFHADYLIHNFTALQPEGADGRTPISVGLGLRVKLEEGDDRGGRNADKDLIGVRVPLGVSYLFDNDAVDLFFEFVPILDVVPDSDFDINAAFGARLYF